MGGFAECPDYPGCGHTRHGSCDHVQRMMANAHKVIPIRPGFDGLILLDERNVFGVLKLYPVNRLAGALADFRGAKTFTPVMVEQCKAMGFTVRTTGAAPRTL